MTFAQKQSQNIKLPKKTEKQKHCYDPQSKYQIKNSRLQLNSYLHWKFSGKLPTQSESRIKANVGASKTTFCLSAFTRICIFTQEIIIN